MQALSEYEAELCPGCGGLLSETTDPGNEYAWVVEAKRCHRCTAIGVTAGTVNTSQPQALLFMSRHRG